MIEILPRCSLLGIPPSVALDLYKQGIDPTLYLSVRGRAEFEALIERDSLKPMGCVEAVLSLPGLKQVREILPVGVKERVKEIMKSAIGDKIEP